MLVTSESFFFFFLTDITIEGIAENLKGHYITGMLELTGLESISP